MSKRALLASLFLLGLAVQPASADFGGLYAGVHAGGLWGDVDTTNVSNGTLYWPLGPGNQANTSVNGVLGGGQLGYDLNLSGWLVGFELSGAFTEADATLALVPDDTYKVGVDWVAMASARLGWVWNNRTLVYAKGGFAAGGVSTAESDIVPVNVGAFSTGETHNGWMAGGGIEHMLSDDVSFGLEYNYIDLGEQDHSAPLIVNNVDVQLQTVSARLNWHFWSP